MVEQILQIGDILVNNRHVIYIRTFLNIVFLTSLTSYLYIHFYGDYTIYSINEYKEILQFFLSGEFLKIGAIYFLTFLTTKIISDLLFELFNYVMRSLLKRAIKAIKGYKVLEEVQQGNPNELEQKHIQKLPKIVLITYNQLKDLTKSHVFTESIQILEMQKNELKNTFLFIIRLIICSWFYLAGSIIGSELLIIVHLFSLLFLLIVILLNSFYDLIPQLLSIYLKKLNLYFQKIEQVN
jgi:hypothetical protein